MLTLRAVGLAATVQDAGRSRHLRFGVPTSGPADRVAHAAANALVGNDPGAAALELVGLPCSFVVDRALLVAVTGRDVRLRARTTIPGWTCGLVRAGEEVRVDGESAYAYLAVCGGIDAAPALGARASYLAARLGPAPLRAGDSVRVGVARAEAERAGLSFDEPPDYASGAVRVLAGPHDDRVDVERFVAGEYTVDPRSDRMGVRLDGPALEVRGSELLTCGMVEGAVQVSGGGRPIVLLADHQTTGGYPVVATVIAADLPIVAQAASGARLSFRRVAREEAEAALQRVRRAVFRVRVAEPAMA